jgi:hypothetical protein
MTKTFFHKICEDLEKDLIVDIQSQLRNQHQIKDFFNDCAKFEFWDGLLYHDGLLYVPNGINYMPFRFNKSMELIY